MAYQRDPLSVRFDVNARKFVLRAYRNPWGTWTGEYVPPPGPRARAYMLSLGIDRPYERDRWGEVRWLRSYKRSVYHLVNWYGGLHELRGERNTGAGSGGWHAPVRVEWETGVRAQSGEHEGWWAVRIRIWPSGRVTSEVGLHRALRERNNWINPGTRRPNQRQSGPDDRDWESAR